MIFHTMVGMVRNHQSGYYGWGENPWMPGKSCPEKNEQAGYPAGIKHHKWKSRKSPFVDDFPIKASIDRGFSLPLFITRWYQMEMAYVSGLMKSLRPPVCTYTHE